jgi:endoglycosylceramidase
VIWDDSYFISPAVQTSIDNFWQNKEAEDGVGIMDHYAIAWKHVAMRYKDNPVVIGYDIMNEPFMGTQAQQIMPVLFSTYASMIAETTGQAPSMEEIAMTWSGEDTRMEVLQSLSNAEIYGRLMDSTYPINSDFEKNVLQKFYQKVRDSIRTVDNNHIIFIEHSYFSNTGVRSAIEPLVDTDGNRDPLVAYAAHGYDLVTDTKEIGSASDDRVGFIFNRIKENEERLQMPTIIGEWGAYHGKDPGLIPVSRFAVKELNRHLFSDTFWAYYKGIENEPFFKEITKPYPVRTSGELKSYQFHVETGIFRCSWEEDPGVDSPTIIYLPDITEILNEDIDLRPSADQLIIDEIEGSKAGYLTIAPTGKSLKRSVRLTIQKKSSQLTSLDN